MSDANRMSMALVVVVVAIGVLPFVAIWIWPPTPPTCTDYVAEPGIACRVGRSLVIESGVAVCRCPGAMP